MEADDLTTLTFTLYLQAWMFLRKHKIADRHEIRKAGYSDFRIVPRIEV